MSIRRDWAAYINVAAKGTLFQPYQRSDPIGMHPKALANLEYTTADVDYWDDYWRNGDWYGRSPYETHSTLRDTDYATLASRLEEVRAWFAESSQTPGFDGGSIVFCYSGHGREGDGALCLNNGTYFDAEDFVRTCMDIRSSSPGSGPLAVSLIVDSCYSGAFLLKVLEGILHEHPDDLIPDYLFAASMPDEVAWELPVLNHGLATYCQSVRPDSLGAMSATAGGRSDPAWAIAEGPDGCSYITAGAQNPIRYDSYELAGAMQSVRVWEGEALVTLRSRDEWESDLLKARDELYEQLAVLRTRRSMSGRLTEQDVISGERGRRRIYDKDFRRELDQLG